VFSDVTLIGIAPPKPIPLSTRLGNQIDNEPGPAMTEDALKQKQILEKVHGKSWETRIGPVSGYNCAGHVWASRRAAIYEPSEWKRILQEDGYDLIAEKTPLPGDLAIYSLPDGKIIHIAEVIRIEKGLLMQKPFALSKLDDLSGEYIHNVDDVPFKRTFPEYKLEFWTERRRKPK
jgi:hypothetical protein